MYNQILQHLYLGDQQDVIQFEKDFPDGNIIVVLDASRPACRFWQSWETYICSILLNATSFRGELPGPGFEVEVGF